MTQVSQVFKMGVFFLMDAAALRPRPCVSCIVCVAIVESRATMMMMISSHHSRCAACMSARRSCDMIDDERRNGLFFASYPSIVKAIVTLHGE